MQVLAFSIGTLFGVAVMILWALYLAARDDKPEQRANVGIPATSINMTGKPDKLDARYQRTLDQVLRHYKGPVQ